jgi:hypothetical protein
VVAPQCIERTQKKAPQCNKERISPAPYMLSCLLQGPEAWHPAPSPLKEAVARCGQLAAASGVNITDLAIKYSITSGHPQVGHYGALG